METEKEQIKIVNGINVTQLNETMDVIKGNSEISKFTLRSSNCWQDGTHSQAVVSSFYGALEEDNSRTPMVFELDEPPVLLGTNKGANPLEFLLVGLSGCMTTVLVAYAAARGIELKSVQSQVEGDLDVQGFLGLSEVIPVGYKEIRVSFKIEADISDEQKQELIELAQKYSPAFDTVRNPVLVKVDLDRS